MNSLKVFYKQDTPDLPHLIKEVLEASGKFIVWVETEKTEEKSLTGPISFGCFSFDSKMKTLRRKQEEPQRITSREAGILTLLLANPGEIVRRSQILSLLWNDESFYTSRSLDLFIHHLRKLLKPDPSVTLTTIRGERFILTY